jgi:hypothetical protein
MFIKLPSHEIGVGQGTRASGYTDMYKQQPAKVNIQITYKLKQLSLCGVDLTLSPSNAILDHHHVPSGSWQWSVLQLLHSVGPQFVSSNVFYTPKLKRNFAPGCTWNFTLVNNESLQPN